MVNNLFYTFFLLLLLAISISCLIKVIVSICLLFFFIINALFYVYIQMFEVTKSGRGWQWNITIIITSVQIKWQKTVKTIENYINLTEDIIYSV